MGTTNTKKLILNRDGIMSGMMSMGLSAIAIASAALFLNSAIRPIEKAQDDAIIVKQNLIENNNNCTDNFVGTDMDAGPLGAANFIYNGNPISTTMPSIVAASVTETARYASSGSSDQLISMNVNLTTSNGIQKTFPLTMGVNTDAATNVIQDCKWMGGGETVATMCQASGGEIYTSGTGATVCGIPAGMNSFTGQKIIATPETYSNYMVGPMHLQMLANKHSAEVAQEINEKMVVEFEAISAAIQASSTIDAATKNAVGNAVGRIRSHFDNYNNLFTVLETLSAPEYPVMNGLASNYLSQRQAGTNTPIVFSIKESSGTISSYVPASSLLASSQDPTAASGSGLFSGRSSVTQYPASTTFSFSSSSSTSSSSTSTAASSSGY